MKMITNLNSVMIAVARRGDNTTKNKLVLIGMKNEEEAKKIAAVSMGISNSAVTIYKFGDGKKLNTFGIRYGG